MQRLVPQLPPEIASDAFAELVKAGVFKSRRHRRHNEPARLTLDVPAAMRWLDANPVPTIAA